MPTVRDYLNSLEPEDRLQMEKIIQNQIAYQNDLAQYGFLARAANFAGAAIREAGNSLYGLATLPVSITNALGITDADFARRPAFGQAGSGALWEKSPEAGIGGPETALGGLAGFIGSLAIPVGGEINAARKLFQGTNLATKAARGATEFGLLGLTRTPGELDTRLEAAQHGLLAGAVLGVAGRARGLVDKGGRVLIGPRAQHLLKGWGSAQEALEAGAVRGLEPLTRYVSRSALRGAGAGLLTPGFSPVEITGSPYLDSSIFNTMFLGGLAAINRRGPEVARKTKTLPSDVTQLRPTFSANDRVALRSDPTREYTILQLTGEEATLKPVQRGMLDRDTAPVTVPRKDLLTWAEAVELDFKSRPTKEGVEPPQQEPPFMTLRELETGEWALQRGIIDERFPNREAAVASLLRVGRSESGKPLVLPRGEADIPIKEDTPFGMADLNLADEARFLEKRLLGETIAEPIKPEDPPIVKSAKQAEVEFMAATTPQERAQGVTLDRITQFFSGLLSERNTREIPAKKGEPFVVEAAADDFLAAALDVPASALEEAMTKAGRSRQVAQVSPYRIIELLNMDAKGNATILKAQENLKRIIEDDLRGLSQEMFNPDIPVRVHASPEFGAFASWFHSKQLLKLHGKYFSLP